MIFGFGNSAGSQSRTTRQRVWRAHLSLAAQLVLKGNNNLHRRGRLLVDALFHLGINWGPSIACIYLGVPKIGVSSLHQIRPNKKESAKPQKFKSLFTPAFWGLVLVKVKRQEVHQNLFQTVTAKRSVSLKRLISGARILCRILN